MKIGPFFYINNELIFNICELEKGRRQADKIDNSYGHEKLWDDHFRDGEYIEYPRGRVVWDCTTGKSIIYIDPCINTTEIIKEIVEKFEIKEYVIEYDEHYHCNGCIGDIFD